MPGSSIANTLRGASQHTRSAGCHESAGCLECAGRQEKKHKKKKSGNFENLNFVNLLWAFH